MSLLRARTRRLARPPQALALLLPGLGVGVLAALHFRGGESVATTVTVGAVSVLVGVVLARWISRADRDPATRYLIGLAIAGVAIAVRVSPLMFGSVNEVIVIDRGVVVGEIAAVLAIIGIGTMLSTMIEVERHVSRQHALQRPVTRAVALCLAVSPLIPFALASSGDLGPLVILVVAVSAMAGRSINGVWFIVLTALVLTWVALLAVTTIDIARERLADTLSGGFQLDLARLAISYGGLVWGGGFGANAFAESIPVASTDHLAAYLAGSIGVIPFIVIVGCALAALALAARALARPATALTVAATGLVVAASVQTGWALLGSFGALPLTGMPLPGISVSGSSWAAWGIALGLIGAALRRRRDERSMAGLRLAAAQPAARVIGSTVVFTALAAPVIAFVVAVSLIAFPSASGATGALSTVAPRGSIVTSDGVVLAVTGEDGTRRYPLGSAAVETVGLVVPLVNQYGLERSASALLTCAGGGFGAVLLAGVVGPRCSPATVMTTLDSGLQTAAVSAASGPAGGSIIVMRVSTLDVLAAYSLDPGAARPDPNAVATGDLAIEEVSPLEPASSFYPAIFEEAISPGSIFKVPVLAATAELGFAGSLGSVDPGELGVENSWYGPCPSNDIPSAIAYSCNTVTAEIAQAVGQASLSTALSTYFGLDADERLIDGRLVPAGATALPGAPMTTGELSRTVIGLQSVRLTMLDLAAVVAHSVGASPGASPTLVAGTCTPGMWSPSPSPLGGTAVGEPLSASTVATIREGMALAVVDGTASSLLAGVIGDTGDLEVLAKTGTPDREVDGVSVNDSLIVVIVDDYLILTRIQGTPENPTPDEDSPAMTLAQDMLSALLAGWDRLEAAPVCPAATNGEAGS